MALGRGHRLRSRARPPPHHRLARRPGVTRIVHASAGAARSVRARGWCHPAVSERLASPQRGAAAYLGLCELSKTSQRGLGPVVKGRDVMFQAPTLRREGRWHEHPNPLAASCPDVRRFGHACARVCVCLFWGVERRRSTQARTVVNVLSQCAEVHARRGRLGSCVARWARQLLRSGKTLGQCRHLYSVGRWVARLCSTSAILCVVVARARVVADVRHYVRLARGSRLAPRSSPSDRAPLPSRKAGTAPVVGTNVARHVCQAGPSTVRTPRWTVAVNHAFPLQMPRWDGRGRTRVRKAVTLEFSVGLEGLAAPWVRTWVCPHAGVHKHVRAELHML